MLPAALALRRRMPRGRGDWSGLALCSLFGVVIAIFIGIGLVSKAIEKRTLYTVLSRPGRRREFIGDSDFKY